MKTILTFVLLIGTTDLMNGSPYRPDTRLTIKGVSYSKSFEHIISNEGGWSNHPKDRGKLTYKGITRRWNKHWPGWRAPINSSLVKRFYHKIWVEEGFSSLHNQQVANYLFDSRIVLSTRKKSINFLNKCLGLNVKRTKQWVNPSMDTLNLENLKACRCQHYKMIVKKDSSQVVFLKGWLKRANRI